MTQRANHSFDTARAKFNQEQVGGDNIYFVTTNVQNRRWFFVTSERASILGQAIKTCCTLKQFDLLAYCILPDHVHLLVKKQDVVLKQRERDTVTSQHMLGSMCCEKNESENSPVTSQRKLGSLRCDEKKDLMVTQAFLFSHRRLPSRRSVDKPKTVSELMHSIKSTYSQYLRPGKFWQHRFNFRIVGTERYFNHVVDYTRYNYRKMKLNENYGRAPFVFVDWEVVRRIVG
jgi:REP element-mobilizing transposase RayT